jgi:uncharacterized protein (DUF58 family)
VLTRKGRFALAAGFVLTASGLAFANALFLAVGSGFLLLVAVGSFFLRAAHVEATRQVSATVLHEDQVITVETTLHATSGRGRVFLEIQDAVPLAVELSAGSNYALLSFRGQEPVQLSYRLNLPVKGEHRIGPIRLRVQDAFGFFRDDREIDLVTPVVVYPRIFDLRDALIRSKFPLVVSGDYQVGNPGLGSTFFALREYQVGDSIRSINWKASARSSKLVVNQTERESQARVTFLFDAREAAAAGTPRKNASVWNARAASSIARFVLRRRDRVRIFVYGEGINEVDPRGEKQDVILNETLARTGASGSTTLLQAVQNLMPTLKRRSPVVIFSSMLDDPTAQEAVQNLMALEAKVVVISPNPLGFLEAGGVAKEDLLYKTVELEREGQILALKSYGAWVVDWWPDEPFSIVLAREALL